MCIRDSHDAVVLLQAGQLPTVRNGVAGIGGFAFALLLLCFVLVMLPSAFYIVVRNCAWLVGFGAYVAVIVAHMRQIK